MTAQSSSRLLERFTSTVGRWLGIVGIVFLGFVAWSVASTGIDASTVALLAMLALLAIVAWASLVRPSLAAFEDYLFVRNSWSDLRVPWRKITDLDVKQTLHVYSGGERHHSVAIGKSARNMLRDGQRLRSTTSNLFGAGALDDLSQQPTLTGSATTGMNYADYVVLKLQTYVSLHKNEKHQPDEITRAYAWPQIALFAVVAVVFVAAVIVAIVT